LTKKKKERKKKKKKETTAAKYNGLPHWAAIIKEVKTAKSRVWLRLSDIEKCSLSLVTQEPR